MNTIRHSAVAITLLAAFSAVSVSAKSEDNTPHWNRALDTLAQAGYTQIEELELNLLGRFEADVRDAKRVEHDLRLDSEGRRIVKTRSDGSIEDGSDAMSLEQARGALQWLSREGYRDLRQLSGDDGRIEVEARNAEGRRVELSLNPSTYEVLTLEFEDVLDL